MSSGLTRAGPRVDAGLDLVLDREPADAGADDHRRGPGRGPVACRRPGRPGRSPPRPRRCASSDTRSMRRAWRGSTQRRGIEVVDLGGEPHGVRPRPTTGSVRRWTAPRRGSRRVRRRVGAGGADRPEAGDGDPCARSGIGRGVRRSATTMSTAWPMVSTPSSWSSLISTPSWSSSAITTSERSRESASRSLAKLVASESVARSARSSSTQASYTASVTVVRSMGCLPSVLGLVGDLVVAGVGGQWPMPRPPSTGSTAPVT